MIAALHGADGVIHLGGISDEAPFPELVHNNILGTFNVLEAARRQGVLQVVYASSRYARPEFTLEHLEDPAHEPGS